MDPHHHGEFGETDENDDALPSGILNTLISSPFLSNRLIKLSSILRLFPIHHLLIGLKNRRCIGAELTGRSSHIVIRHRRYQLCSTFIMYQHAIIKIGSIGIGIRNICNTARGSFHLSFRIIFYGRIPIGMWRKKIESHFRNGYFSPQMDGCDF